MESHIMLGLLGIWELVILLLVLVVMVAVAAGVIVLVLWQIRRGQKLEGAVASSSPPGRCPRCGQPLPPGAPQGLCPRCVLGVGLETETDAGAGTGPHGTKVAKPPPPAPADLARLFPQLEITECLGRGGMGAVYKARQPKLDRWVALKILTPERQADAQFRERFEREARTLARLSHPNIVAVYDFGETNGYCYLLMEFVDGVTLRQLIQNRKLTPEEALGIVPKVCEALEFAHGKGVVHRDIKPENILLDRVGQVKIADFGIAKILEPGWQDFSLTGAKDVIGTPHYMAPEQVEQPAKVDHRADIFSLGVVFYEMLTGELPLGKFAPPSRKVQVDVRLDEIVLHALEKEPERRYQHASEVKTDVEMVAGAAASPRAGEGEDKTAAGAPLLPSSLGLTFVSRKALKVARAGWVLGCVGALGFIPGLKWMFGFAGFFGLIGVAVLIELMHRSKHGVPVGSSGRRPSIDHPAPPLKWVVVVRWTARIFSTLLLAFYGLFILAEGLPPIAMQPEGVQLNFIALGLMFAGFVIGWKREGIAALLIASGWVLRYASEGRMDWDLFQTPLPVAVLYGVCWWASRGRRTNVVVAAVASLAVALGLGLLLLPTSVFVSGQVTDAQTGQPVREVELRLLPRPQRSDKGDFPSARADATGRFRLYVGWFTASKQVTLAAPGYVTVTANLGPRAFGSRRVTRDFQLQPTSATPAPDLRVPPVVVATFPPAGTADVDPALTELRVTFSQPMRDNSWAWVKLDDASYPEMTGSPCFLPDRRTCVLPVKLQPGRVYATWINVDDFLDFRADDGSPAVPYLLVFETRK